MVLVLVAVLLAVALTPAACGATAQIPLSGNLRLQSGTNSAPVSLGMQCRLHVAARQETVGMMNVALAVALVAEPATAAEPQESTMAVTAAPDRRSAPLPTGSVLRI